MIEENSRPQKVLIELEDVLRQFSGANILFLNDDPLVKDKLDQILSTKLTNTIIVFTRIGDQQDYTVFEHFLRTESRYFVDHGKINNFMIVITAHEDTTGLSRYFSKHIKFIHMPTLYAWYTKRIYADGPPKPVKLEKHFLSYNNRRSWYRQALYLAFYKYHLLDKSYFSYLDKRGTGILDSISMQEIENEFSYNGTTITRPYSGVNVSDALTKLPYQIAGENIPAADHWPGTWNCNSHHYNTSFCSVVTESYVLPMSGIKAVHHSKFRPAVPRPPMADVFITEKVFKPMVMQQPFLVFGNARILEYLQTLGFETFDQVLDESYDQQIYSGVRFDLLLDEILKIGMLPLERLETMRQKLTPVLEHNRNHFYNQLPKMYERELQRVSNELQQAISAALAQM